MIMGFKQFFTWRIQSRINQLFQKHRPCNICRGSNGHCDMCNERHNLFKRDWERAYMRRLHKKQMRRWFGK